MRFLLFRNSIDPTNNVAIKEFKAPNTFFFSSFSLFLILSLLFLLLPLRSSFGTVWYLSVFSLPSPDPRLCLPSLAIGNPCVPLRPSVRDPRLSLLTLLAVYSSFFGLLLSTPPLHLTTSTIDLVSSLPPPLPTLSEFLENVRVPKELFEISVAAAARRAGYVRSPSSSSRQFANNHAAVSHCVSFSLPLVFFIFLW